MTPKDYEKLREQARANIADPQRKPLVESAQSEVVVVKNPDELIRLVRKAG